MVLYPLSTAVAFALDLLVGDPAWLPHPVAGLGRLIAGLQPRLLRWRQRRLAGVVLVAVVAGVAGTAAGLTLWAAARIGWPAELAAMTLLIWMALATRGLLEHAEAVRRPLLAGDLEQARAALARMVSRDTGEADATAIARGCIESVAENFVDGILAPLLFAAAGGAIAVWSYKAVSTLDSMVGYQREPYREFGWASARLDDLLNYLPARLSALFLPAGAALTGGSAWLSWRVLWRDHRRNPSPNSGWPEAAIAGALNIELGGWNRYGGQWVEKPPLNAGARAAAAADLRRAQATVLTAALLAALALVGIACWT